MVGRPFQPHTPFHRNRQCIDPGGKTRRAIPCHLGFELIEIIDPRHIHSQIRMTARIIQRDRTKPFAKRRQNRAANFLHELPRMQNDTGTDCQCFEIVSRKRGKNPIGLFHGFVCIAKIVVPRDDLLEPCGKPWLAQQSFRKTIGPDRAKTCRDPIRMHVGDESVQRKLSSW